VFNNLRKFVGYLLSSNIAEVLIIFLASLFGWPLPLVAIQILWINLITDGPPALALGVDKTSSSVMKEPPRDPKENIINKLFAIRIMAISLIITSLCLGIYWHYLNINLVKAQTMIFSLLILLELINVYVIRGHYTDKIFSNKYLTISVISSILLLLLIIYTPLSKIFKVINLNFIDWIYLIITTALLAITGIILDKIVDKITKHHSDKVKKFQALDK
jgi:Ca2+-transporting ATPase